MARVLVAMSGGVDSSVAAALLTEEGHDVEGATLKLWGGDSDSGCCSVADVEDARRVAQQLGIRHHVFSFTDDFDEHVVAPYVAAHAAGDTPNPCVECNRHLKFDRFTDRARLLGFDAVATGHHARVERGPDRWHLRRGADAAKDQSYVLHMLGQGDLARLMLPVGAMTKADVREIAARLHLRTAEKPDSQDVCFITKTGGRRRFLSERLEFHEADVVDATTGAEVGTVPAVELVTVGQRRGLGTALATDGRVRYAVEVDVPGRRIVVGDERDLLVDRCAVAAITWVGDAVADGQAVLVQTSAHGSPEPATWTGDAFVWDTPTRRVAPGQSVAVYDVTDPTDCLGGGTAT